MATQWKLRGFLDAHKITPNALAEQVKGKVSKNAIYNLVGKEEPAGVNFRTLDAVLPALAEMTHKEVRINDVLDYEAPPPEPEWMRLAGAFDDPESPGDVAERHDYYLDQAVNQEHEESIRGER